MNFNQRDKENADEESNECNQTDSQDKFPQTQHAAKRPGSSHKNQSRPSSRAASISQQPQTQSNSQSKLWNSTNPFINFMSEFRKNFTKEKSANIFRLGGEQWRNMPDDAKQPFIDAANQNKKAKPRSDRNQQQKQIISDKQQSKTGTSKDTMPSNSNSSQAVSNLKKKRKRSKQRRETQLKKKRTKSETETDTDTNTSDSIHGAATDCASDDSDEST